MYATLLSVVLIAVGVATLVRARVDLSIDRDRVPNFVTLSNGGIRNGYTLRIENRTTEPAHYQLHLEGLHDAKLRIGAEGPGFEALDVPPNKVATFKMFIQAPRDVLQHATTPIELELADDEHGRNIERATVFVGPAVADHRNGG